MFRKILVPTDFSAEGERALPAIARFAHNSGATVVLLHVVENVSVDAARVVPPTAYLPGMQDELEQVRVELERRRGEFHEGVELVLDAQVAASVPEAIAAYAGQHGCDVIALSTHGRSGLRRVIMGSVAEALMRLSGVPVLVFPPSAAGS